MEKKESYIISCCSTADLDEQYFMQNKIHYICFHYELDGQQYPDDLGKTMPFDQFYQKMTEGAMTRTSQVNADEFEQYFEPFLKEGKDVVHVCLSSGISGVINSAMIAKEILEERYPMRHVYVIDSLAASSGFGMLVTRMAQLREEGYTAEQLYQWTEEEKGKLNSWFFSTDLTFYIRGGRVSKTAGIVGGLLGICPLLYIAADGTLQVDRKIRSKKKAIAAVVEKMQQLIPEEEKEKTDVCYISHSACYDTARETADKIEAQFPSLKGKVKIFSIGTTIGSHTGPGTVAVFFWGKERRNKEL